MMNLHFKFGFLIKDFRMGTIMAFAAITYLLTWAMFGIYMLFAPSAEEIENGGAGPAGRIHLFGQRQYLNSADDNPFNHDALVPMLASGDYGVLMHDELMGAESYQTALVGTVQVFKPEQEKGSVAGIIDNAIARGLGLRPVGLTDLASDVVTFKMQNPTLHG